MLRWSPDGIRLAAVGTGPELLVWNVETREVAQFDVGGGELCGLSWSADGQCLAAASNARMRVWQVSDESLVSELRVEYRIDNIAWSPIDGHIAVIDTGSIKLVSSTTGKVVDIVVVDRQQFTYELAWSPDGNLLAGSRGIGGVRVWNVSDGSLFAEFGSNMGSVLALTWSPDGERLAAGSREGRIGLWNPVTKDLVRLRCYEEGIQMLSWAPDSRRLASTSEHGGVRIWDTRSATSCERVEGQYFPRPRLHWEPGGRHLVVVPDDGRTATLWDVETRRATSLIEPGDRQSIRQAVTWAPDGGSLAMSDAERIVTWDVRNGRVSQELTPIDQAIDAIALGPRNAGSPVAWAHTRRGSPGSCDVEFSTTAAGRHTKSRTLDVTWVNGLSWSPNGAQLAVAMGTRVLVWNIDTESDTILEVTSKSHWPNIESLQWSPCGERLAATYAFGHGVIWDVRTSTVVAETSAPGGPARPLNPTAGGFGTGGSLRSVAWTQDGDLLAAGSAGAKIWHGPIWEAPKPRPRWSLRRPTRPSRPPVNWVDLDSPVEVAISSANLVAVVDPNGWTTVLDGEHSQPQMSLNANGEAWAWVDGEGRYELHPADGWDAPLWATSGLDRSEIGDGQGWQATGRVGPSANPCQRVGDARRSSWR